MSIKIMTAVWEESQHKGAALLMLLALADHANDEGVCWPGIARLAQRARVSTRQTQLILADLIKSGELYALRGAGRGHTNLYLVTIGHTSSTLTKVLVNRFDMATDAARRLAAEIVARRTGKGEAHFTFSPQNGEVFDAKGEVLRTKGEVFGVKGEAATSPEPMNRQLTLTEPDDIPTTDDVAASARRETWEIVRSHLRLQLPQSTYDTWVRDTELIDVAGDAYTVRCVNDYAREWLNLRLRRLIKQTLVSIVGRPVTVEFTTRPRPGLLQ